MALEKAQIQIDGGAVVTVLFNPNEYTVTMHNQFRNTYTPGSSTDDSKQQYIGKDRATLSMELFFDTYMDSTSDNVVDVRTYTSKITDAFKASTSGGTATAPPALTFTWGQFSFKGKLTQLTQRYTMFWETGVPVRSTLSITLEEADVSQPQESSASLSADLPVVTVDNSTQMATLAAMFLGSANQWRQIAEANNIDNPRTLSTGTDLVVPR